MSPQLRAAAELAVRVGATVVIVAPTPVPPAPLGSDRWTCYLVPFGKQAHDHVGWGAHADLGGALDAMVLNATEREERRG